MVMASLIEIQMMTPQLRRLFSLNSDEARGWEDLLESGVALMKLRWQ